MFEKPITSNKWGFVATGVAMIVIVMSFWPNPDHGFDLPKTVNFNYHIRPILSQNCLVCHGNDPASREADLRLDLYESATAKLSHGGAAIVPGNVNKSLMIQRITSGDPNEQMPPPEAKKDLTAREIALVKKWIRQGAKYEQQWSLVAPVQPDLPNGLMEASTPTLIDHFIDKAQQDKNISPASEANKNNLIRRVSYLLTGLPPSTQELDYFLSNESKHAYEQMIDRFLSSPAYGERWARHWMDLVRYGESMGHEGDFNISHAWEYRDYLIRAFNQDVPYDLFVKEHLAGDMLEHPREHPTEGFNESILGTGYLFLGDGKHSPVDTRAEESDKIDNMIDVTTKTFQALTVACARCHDHKFDPIPTTDYYAMYGMIESTRLVPKAARQPMDQMAQLEKITSFKNEMKKELILKLENELTDEEDQLIQKYLENILSSERVIPDTSLHIMADFRDGEWDGWYTDGIAFGNGAARAEITVDQGANTINLLSGCASSRTYGSGIQGVLNSSNFIIKDDYIAIRAAGSNGTVRVVVDNFHVIQNPLWGGLQAHVDDSDWKTYVLDVGLAKGHKAYLEFFPGTFKSHVYNIGSSDFIDIEYAVGYSNKEHPIVNDVLEHPLRNSIVNLRETDVREAKKAWLEGQVDMNQAHLLSAVSPHATGKNDDGMMPKMMKTYRDLVIQLQDSTHFIGMMDGEAIHSPVFNRGSIGDLSKEKVPHGFLSMLNRGIDTFPQQGSGRLAWAAALVDPHNPLTSRVIVNRIWHYLFGRGIVETVDNFGLQGKMPSHPELLDYLAITFVKESWSIKKLIKGILLSDTFRRSSIANEKNIKVDPNNYLLHHYPIRRLEAEAIRDGILATTGCIDRQMYGEGVPVYLSEFMTGRGRPDISGPLDSYGRRSIYMTVRRNFIPPFMQTFDTPIPFSTFGKRNVTNVPAQSLALLNDPFVHEQAQHWADHLLAKGDLSVEEKIADIFKTAFSRTPSVEEVTQAISFLKLQAQGYGSTIEEMKSNPLLWTDYCHSVFNLKEFIHLL